jgi:DNA-binding CsgD family transcriptional regulator
VVLGAGASGATWLAAASGRPTFAWIFAFTAIMSLYGAVDHLVEPAAHELLAPVPAAAPSRPGPVEDRARAAQALTSRQRRVLRFLAYGLPDDEIAELLGADEAAIRSDIERIVAVLGADDRAQAVEAARHAGILTGGRVPGAHAAA